jgi:hypothetical protein
METLTKWFPEQAEEMSFKLCERFANLALNISAVEIPNQDCLNVLNLTAEEFFTIASRRNPSNTLHTIRAMMEKLGVLVFTTSATQLGRLYRLVFNLAEEKKYRQASFVLRSQTPLVLDVMLCPAEEQQLAKLQTILSDRFFKASPELAENLETIYLLWTLLGHKPGADCVSKKDMLTSTMPRFLALLTARVNDLIALDPYGAKSLYDLVQRCFLVFDNVYSHIVGADVVAPLFESIKRLIEVVKPPEQDQISMLVSVLSHCTPSSITKPSWDLLASYPNSIFKGVLDSIRDPNFRRGYFNWALSSPLVWSYWGDLFQSDPEWLEQQLDVSSLGYNAVQTPAVQERLDLLWQHLQAVRSRSDAVPASEIAKILQGWVKIYHLLREDLPLDAIVPCLNKKAQDQSFIGLLEWIMHQEKSIANHWPSYMADLCQLIFSEPLSDSEQPAFSQKLAQSLAPLLQVMYMQFGSDSSQ